MFTVAQLKAVHSKVKTGADFPAYIREIKALGLISYAFIVTDGVTIYSGPDGYEVRSVAIYPPFKIEPVPQAETLRHNIAIHQQGQTDFLTFCSQAAAAGVEKWVIDTQKMMCTYYDLTGSEMVAEPIPGDEYK